jgi:hypothetical protein
VSSEPIFGHYYGDKDKHDEMQMSPTRNSSELSMPNSSRPLLTIGQLVAGVLHHKYQPVHKPSSRKDLLAHYFMVAAEIRLRRSFGPVQSYKLASYGRRVCRQQHTTKTDNGRFKEVLPMGTKHRSLRVLPIFKILWADVSQSKI